MRPLALAGIAALVLATGVQAEGRPRLGGASAVRIANYNSPSVLLEKRDDVRSIIEDLNQLRKRGWSRGETKVSCYSTVVLTSGKKRVGEFRVAADAIVERPVEKGAAGYSLPLEASDLPALRRRLAEIMPAKDCN
ncbi:MAG TPA: hypothetical protein VN747_10140 [Burkholderiales bacterium]|jgi:hypothetical protein|nr:hypothetical protein [Burkholderiales bacterium]